MEKIYLTINEAVDYLKGIGFPISKATLYKQTMEKTIPFQRFGKQKLVFKTDDLKTWAEGMLTSEVEI